MNYLRPVMVLALGGLGIGAALAQSTIGELLAAGGKQLSKDEVLATLRGATVTGATAAGGEIQVEYKENGSMSGYVTGGLGSRGSVFGTWTVDDSGKVCRDLTIRFRETSQIKDCLPLYRLADQFYIPATGSTAPSAGIVKRTIKR